MSLSLQTLQRIADLFTYLFQGERQAEIMRQVLVEQSNFSPSTLYSHIGQGKEIINIKDIAIFLDSHQISYQFSQLELIVFTFAHSLDELPYQSQNMLLNILISRFLNMILPSSQASLRLIKIPNPEKKSKLHYTMKINDHIECAFIKLIEQELKLVSETEEMKENLKKRWDFTIESTFQAILNKKNNFIDHLCLKRFFHSVNLQVTEDDLIYLLRRTDKDRDSFLSQSDLFWSLSTYDNIKQALAPKSQRMMTNINKSASKVPTQINNKKSGNLTARKQNISPLPLKTSNKIIKQRASQNASISNLNKSYTLDKSNLNIEGPDVPQVPNFSPLPYDVIENKKPFVSFSEKKDQSSFVTTRQVSPIKQNEPHDIGYIYGVDQRVMNEDVGELVKLLIGYLDQWQLVDQTRCKLVQCPEFSLQKCFKYFRGQTNIQYQNFEEGVLNLNSNIKSKDEIKQLFKLFDLDQDGLLSYEEMSQIFEPASEYYATILYGSESRFNQQDLNAESREVIKILFEQILQMDILYQEQKQQFFQKKRYSLLSIFEYLNLSKSGMITLQDLTQLLEQFDFQVSQTELDQIFKKFSKEKIKVKQLTMRQFLNELTPAH